LFSNAVQHCKWCYTKLLGAQEGQTFHKGSRVPWPPQNRNWTQLTAVIR